MNILYLKILKKSDEMKLALCNTEASNVSEKYGR